MATDSFGFATPDAILSHPRFVTARSAYIDAVLDLYEMRPSLLEIMRDGGRIFVYGIIMALWGGYREDEPASWPTTGRLKSAVGRFAVASPRQIDAIIARFAHVGHLSVMPAPQDKRRRLVLPTASLIEHDRSFIRAHYLPLGELFGEAAYARPLARDLAFLKAARGAWIATLDAMARDIILTNRPILRFYTASAGMLMLMRLARLQDVAATAWVDVDYSDFGRRFAVSRTHVRTLFQAMAADGHGEVRADGAIAIGPGLRAALDRNIAERLSLLDRARGAAMARLGTSAPP